jgi:hypothetical protein
MPKKGNLDPNASERSVYQRKYNSKPEQKKRRASRNGARREAEKIHGKSALVGKDVDHTVGNTKGDLDNKKTRIISSSTNRSAGAKASHRNRSIY